MGEPLDNTDAETEIAIGHDMISATTKISALSPPKTTINHLMSGARGQKVEFLQGTPEDIKDIFDLNKARGKQWGPKLFMFAPGPMMAGKPAMTREFFLSVAWPAAAAMFNIPAAEGIICEHVPQRDEDEEHDHWHVAVNHYDPLTGKARNWSWDRAKLERFSRSMELLTGGKVLVGRFQPLVIRTLREMGENEMADAIEKANPPDAQPAGRTAKRTVEQAAKAKNIDLRVVERSVRAAYVAAADRASFRAALAELGLALEVSYRIPHRPAWVIHKDGEFLRTLGGCLPRVAMATILKKLGAPEHDEQANIFDAIASASAGPGRGDPGVRGSGSGNGDVHRAGAGLEGAAGPAPDRTFAGNRAAFAGVFVRVLTSMDPVKIREMQQQVDQIMVSPLLRGLQYFRKVINQAKSFMTRIFPAESPFLTRSRAILKEARDAHEKIENQAKEQARKLQRLRTGADLVAIDKAERDALLIKEKEALRLIDDALFEQRVAVENVVRVNSQFERAHAFKVAGGQRAIRGKD
ncbi:hypothetical protein ACVWXL_008987 [Bradyrhizobium sp. GM22.5]